MIEHRREPRTEANLKVCVWGIDVHGERFLENVVARNISLSGALLSELETTVRSGDLIGVLYAGRKARFRVVWLRHSGTNHKIQAAIHRVAADECPWMELLVEAPVAVASAASSVEPSTNV